MKPAAFTLHPTHTQTQAHYSICTSSQIAVKTWKAQHKMQLSAILFSDQITRHKAHDFPIASFYCPTPPATITQVMWTVLAWTMLPPPRSVHGFVLQSDFPQSFAGRLLQIETTDVTACDGSLSIYLFRSEVQVLRHIPEIAVALVNCECR